jgi:thymidylate synthase (FAD)
MRISVLDRGYVELVDFMGGDDRVVEAARVSRLSHSKGEESDRRLLEFLLKMGHTSPFEHSVFTFRVKAPIFVFRQWMRHRIASYVETSLRYVEKEKEYYLPPLGEREREEYVRAVERAFEAYENLLEAGVRKEVARCVLPFATYSQMIWTVNVRSLMNFFLLRLDFHAQREIREYAFAVFRIFKEKMPITAEVFERMNPSLFKEGVE